MRNMAVPDAILYKVVRAHEHLQSLEAELNGYYKSHPAKVVRQDEGSPDEYIARVITDEPIPAKLPVILGDFIQNLRSSLDYLVWELVIAAKDTPGKHNMFPICSTPEAFQYATVKQRRLASVPVDAVALIERLQPYNGGDFNKALLWIVDDLCNINKHRRIPLTRMHGGLAPSDTETKIVNGEIWTRVDLSKIKDDTKIGPFPIVEGSEGPGIQMPMNLQLVAFIALDEGAAKGMHVTAVLAGMLRYVHEEVLPIFEQFFH
jgi:hypothetical protein